MIPPTQIRKLTAAGYRVGQGASGRFYVTFPGQTHCAAYESSEAAWQAAKSHATRQGWAWRGR